MSLAAQGVFEVVGRPVRFGVHSGGEGGAGGFDGPGGEVRERAGFVGADVGRGDDGEAALIARGEGAGGGIAGRAAGLEGDRLRELLGGAARVVEIAIDAAEVVVRAPQRGRELGGAQQGIETPAVDAVPA